MDKVMSIFVASTTLLTLGVIGCGDPAQPAMRQLSREQAEAALAAFDLPPLEYSEMKVGLMADHPDAIFYLKILSPQISADSLPGVKDDRLVLDGAAQLDWWMPDHLTNSGQRRLPLHERCEIAVGYEDGTKVLYGIRYTNLDRLPEHLVGFLRTAPKRSFGQGETSEAGRSGMKG